MKNETQNSQKKSQSPGESESALELSFFKQFAESVTLGFGIATIEGITEYVNPAMCKILEIEPEEILGTSFILFYPPEMQKKLKEEVFPTLMEKGYWNGELTIYTKSGNLIHTSESYSVIYDEKNNPRYVIDVLMDICELKRLQRIELEKAELEKKKSEERFEKIFNISSDMICITDINGSFRLLNPAWEKNLGYSIEELEGKPIFDFIHPNDKDSTLRCITEEMKNGETILRYKNRYIHKNGNEV